MARRAPTRTSTVTISRSKPGRPERSASKTGASSRALSDGATGPKRKLGRPKGSKNKAGTITTSLPVPARPPLRVTAPKAAAPVRRATAATHAEAAPKVSKDELRAQVQKLTVSSEKLHAKLREATKAAKVAASRIAVLEEQVAQLERTARPAAPEPGPAPRVGRGTASRARRPRHDPGDAVPPGVAVEEPLPLDDEAKAARDKLEHHLAPD